MTVSSLLHALTIKGKVYPRPKIDPIACQQWRALAPLASNINQLARSVHQGHIAAGPDVSDELIALHGILAEIRDRLTGGGINR